MNKFCRYIKKAGFLPAFFIYLQNGKDKGNEFLIYE